MRSNSFRDFRVSTLSPLQLRYAKKRQALAHYRARLEPLLPQAESSLPRDLPRLIDNEAGYFSDSFHRRPESGNLRNA